MCKVLGVYENMIVLELKELTRIKDCVGQAWRDGWAIKNNLLLLQRTVVQFLELQLKLYQI